MLLPRTGLHSYLLDDLARGNARKWTQLRAAALRGRDQAISGQSRCTHRARVHGPASRNAASKASTGFVPQGSPAARAPRLLLDSNLSLIGEVQVRCAGSSQDLAEG